MSTARLLTGDCRSVLATLPDESVHCVVTSPPYWGLRDYGVAGQLGLEATPEEWTANMVDVFRDVRRILRADGTFWLNVGDCYFGAKNFGTGEGSKEEETTDGVSARRKGRLGAISGAKPQAHATLKEKDLVGQGWRLAFALQADGWYLRSDIIWSKPNPMPESVTDRPTKAHEYLFLLAKSKTYFYDAEAIREDAGTPHRAGANSHANADRDPAHGTRKQDALGLGTYVGFNDRWDAAVENGTALGGRNKRTVWTIPPASFAEAHFATFPPALVEPCILAGTSEKGACPACGAPWMREVQREQFGKAESATKFTEGASGRASVSLPAGIQSRWTRKTATTAHHRLGAILRECPASPSVPCTVLDPFSGAGTTALVALRHGRSAIGIELNPEYVEMARKRIAADQPLYNRVEVA